LLFPFKITKKNKKLQVFPAIDFFSIFQYNHPCNLVTDATGLGKKNRRYHAREVI
jgi:hypothetical protein